MTPHYTLLPLLFLLVSFTNIQADAMLNVNPILTPDRPNYIDPKLVETKRGGFMGEAEFKIILPYEGAQKNRKKMPLVVMMHGCGQTAQSFVESTNLLLYTQRVPFIVLAPEQNRARNPFNCWNYFDKFSQDAFEGSEADQVYQMIVDTIKDYPIDSRRVYITGISAGAGMAYNLVVTHPELFKAIAVQAAPSYGHYVDMITGARIMLSASGLEGAPTVDDPMLSPNNSPLYPQEEQEKMALNKFGLKSKGKRNQLKNVVIVHGELDPIVSMKFSQLSVEQFNRIFSSQSKEVESSKQLVDAAEKGSYEYTYKRYKNDASIESFMIKKMSHSWSGGDGRTFTAPSYIDSSILIAERFGLFFDQE